MINKIDISGSNYKIEDNFKKYATKKIGKLDRYLPRGSKKDVVAIGKKLGIPYELTWSCYEGSDRPCGKCATCLDRRAAFLANGIDLI